MAKIIFRLFACSLFFLLNSLFSTDAEAPNPLSLGPNWFSYFEIENTELEQRIEKTKSLLTLLSNQLEDSEEKTRAEKKLLKFNRVLMHLFYLKTKRQNHLT